MKEVRGVFVALGILLLLIASVGVVSAFWPFSTTGRVTDDYNAGANILVSSARGFNGVSEYNEVGSDNLKPLPTKAVTVAGWFRTESFGSATVSSDGSRSQTEITGSWVSKRDSFILDPETDGSVKFWVFVDGAWYSVSTGPNRLSPNTWEHWAGTWDGETLSIYRGGILEASTSISGKLGTSGNVCLGHDCGLPAPYDNRYFQGSMTDVRIYANALSEQAVKGPLKNKLPFQQIV